MNLQKVEVQYAVMTDDNQYHYLHSYFTITKGNARQKVKEKILKSLSGIKSLTIINIKHGN